MIRFDSREVQKGDTFVALKGVGFDGHDFIAAAIERGAARVVCERAPEGAQSRPVVIPSERSDEGSVEIIVVPDSHRALGEMASEYYDHPSRRLRLVGITGTNGKTTTTTLLYDLARKLGYEAGLISTVEYRIGTETRPSTHTTPDPVTLNKMLAEMVARGCEFCFMEVSSHAAEQKRIAGLTFAGGAFTNITHDHLDYHLTMASYLAAKKSFFDALPREAFALINIDDKNGRVMVQNTKARIKTLSLRSMADYRCKVVEQHADGMLLQIDGTELWTGFIGRFNACNLLTVYGAARELGFEREETLTAISTLTPVRGRFETVRSSTGITAIVDYAHTPDALANVLDTIAEIRAPGTRLFTVVGCGGERDRAKRPVMARIAAEKSYMTFLTSDNPRSEDPLAILQEMKQGLDPTHKAIAIPDRREAIRAAAAMASPGDIILVAGKGHETYQITGTGKHHFDDKEEIEKCFTI